MKRPSHSPARFARLALSAWTALSAVGIFCPLMARATDLGTVGPTYEIAEPHLLQMIEQRLREKERSGELARIEQEARQRGTDSVRQPTPVAGVRTTAAPRTFYYDPTYTLDQNILGAKGELLFAAGTQANPLNVVSMTRHLLFFDARCHGRSDGDSLAAALAEAMRRRQQGGGSEVAVAEACGDGGGGGGSGGSLAAAAESLRRRLGTVVAAAAAVAWRQRERDGCGGDGGVTSRDLLPPGRI